MDGFGAAGPLPGTTTAMAMLAHGGHEHVETFIGTAPLMAGLVVGAAHVITGPDHLAAVTPLAMRHRERTWVAGCLWGLGHSVGVWVLALVALLLREVIPLEAMSSWSERLVGLTLVAVGLWGLHGVLRLHVHAHRHVHPGPDGRMHAHDHVHVHAVPLPAALAGAEPQHRHDAGAHRHRHGLLGIGTLHGVAGTSHLVGVLPALALPDRTTAAIYVAALGLGSILGMGVFTGGLGMLMRAADRVGAFLSRALMATGSAAAVVVGVVWLGRTGGG